MSGRTYSDEEIQEVFDMLDADGSGKLETRELCHALNLLNVDLTDEEITTTYSIDDDPESLSFEEFRIYVKERIEPMDIDCHQRVLDAFHEFEDGEDGKITRETLKEILTARGSNPITDEEAEEMINECDADGNGLFSAQELAQLLCTVMDHDHS